MKNLIYGLTVLLVLGFTGCGGSGGGEAPVIVNEPIVDVVVVVEATPDVVPEPSVKSQIFTNLPPLPEIPADS